MLSQEMGQENFLTTICDRYFLEKIFKEFYFLAPDFKMYIP